jgi:hypothetical protein
MFRSTNRSEIAYPYKDDTAVSSRSRSYGVEGTKPTTIRWSETTEGLLEDEKRRRRIEVAKHQRIAAPPKDEGESSATVEAAAS